MNNFTDGLLNPVLAYAVSCLGGFLGLRCVFRGRSYHGPGRAGWLTLAAISIGATGIWAMHFIAMLGFTVAGQQMTYNIPKTIASMLLAIVVIGIGLVIVGYGRVNWARILIGGTIIGAGVAAMHYMGMEGMVMPDNLHYQPVLVVLSILIAIVAGSAALWAGSYVQSMSGSIFACMILGVAVVGMHYTGMAAMRLSLSSMPPASGTTAFTFVVPLVVGLTVMTFGITMALLLGRSEEEIAEDVLLDQRASALAAGRPGFGAGARVTFTGPQPRPAAAVPEFGPAAAVPRSRDAASGPQPRPAG
ncbi:MAG: hypothetical protein J2P29_04810, partial [Actinobacteria bacterium]|nr:hypothetical protein [Actinomycetota bacterium]